MSGPIVRTGASPEFWENWQKIFGPGDAPKGKGKKKEAGKKPATASKAKAAAKPKAAAKKPAGKPAKKTTKGSKKSK
ncbi:MAG: RNA polymerase subunit sigma [Planctomycetaceae bacterium]|nr:RNA polymerase subunit sigma [Planctomycetaceae bacterium]